MLFKRRNRVYCAALLCGVAFVVSCDDLPTGPARTPQMTVRGITLADWTSGGYASPSAQSAVNAIAAVGANTVVLIRTAYQTQLSSNSIATDSRTPTTSSLETAAAWSRALGLRVVLKPHVDVDTGAWRGNIRPGDASAWFESYGAFIMDAARLAERLGADQFVVGTELSGTVGHDGRWRALIASVRTVYSGEVAYAASWDGASRITFWDAVDVVGVDFYGAVTRRNDPGRVEILAGWQPWLDRLHLLHKLTGTPIVLTEIGYRSVDGAGREPFAFGNGAVVDVGEQADLYWAALQAVGERDWIEGMYWWNWLATDEGGTANTDYTPRGKPAQGELNDAWN